MVKSTYHSCKDPCVVPSTHIDPLKTTCPAQGQSGASGHIKLTYIISKQRARRWGRGAAKMANPVKCLPYKHEDLNSIPKSTYKMPGCGSGEAEMGRSFGLAGSHSTIIGRFQHSEKPCFQRAKWIAPGEQQLRLASTWTGMCRCPRSHWIMLTCI